MKILIFSIILFLSSNLFSQNKSIDVGIKLGGGISFMTGKFSKGLKPNISYALNDGFSLRYNSSKIFFLQTDLTFERKTFSNYITNIQPFPSPSDPKNILIVRNYDYLSLTILPGIKTKGKTSFNISVGPFFNYILSLTDTQPNVGSTTNYNQGASYELGGAFNLGLKKQISKKISLYLLLEDRFSFFSAKKTFPTNSLLFSFNIYWNLALNKKPKK